MPRKLTPAERLARFWGCVDRRGADECWPWLASTHRDGYGMFRFGKKFMSKTHRVSWEIHFGQIPGDKHVLHHCDNPPCVNPAHLYLGDHAKNMRDKADRGRVVSRPHRGSKHCQAKLTEDTVREIRRRYTAEEISQRALAEQFGVTQSTISMAVSGKGWAHV